MVPKVVFINPWDRLTGPNRYLFEILRNAPDLAAQAIVVFHESNDASDEYKGLGCQTAVWPEIRLIHPRFTASNTVRFLLNHTYGLISVLRRLRALSPDAVVSNTEIVLIGGMAARLLGIPHFQVVHSLMFKYHWDRLKVIVRRYVQWLSCFATRLIGVSDTVRQMLLDYQIDDDKIVVVPNGFDAQWIRNKSESPLPADVEDLIRGRYPILVSVGRVGPMKGQDILIEAANRIRVVYPLLLCLIVGRVGSEEGVENVAGFNERLVQRVVSYRLQDCVHFIGEVDYVPELLGRSDLYVQPSRTESFSRVVAEALICGRPVVCSNAGALPEIAGFGGAVFVPPGDSDALAQGVLGVLSEDSFRQRLTISGRAHVEDHYAIEGTAKAFLDILQSVGNGTGLHDR